uniref:Uncharacterized protein n=1 Tax=Caenorhabditis japonica TaxID=281687 RepID=A0A8R1IBI2_CAEJA
MPLDLEGLHSPQEQFEEEDEGSIEKEASISHLSIVTTLLVSFFAVYLIFAGSLKTLECPAEPKLLTWMIMCGAFLLLERTIAMHFQISKYKFRKENKKPLDLERLRDWEERRKHFKLRPLTQDLMWLAIFIQASFGAFWLQRVPDSFDTCDNLIFFPSVIFCSLILVPSFMSLLCLCTCCCYKKVC